MKIEKESYVIINARKLVPMSHTYGWTVGNNLESS